ncbi:hypothetical protein K493DRAFT_339602 [Basidiobolus meristosporus CBS 931.73]|uniref:Uncharacterized protein n=1 Tax=Basidiobolus meristosporus CBS 931.73 TaxID=1314790 RepID=A0A1Y1XZ77_9FUNG|nr:hypothetical protein K493DRAFT_339602 [Basidiobolus meristosporus CBS 931.73]|eukprot:ORX91029.1 hypothetical protein K493DRAFT_339602 [Basidiobolus meristosporus CBS 931.73]
MHNTDKRRSFTGQSILESDGPLVTIVVRDVARIKTITLRVPQGTRVRKVTEMCCEKFEYWEEWNYAIYSDLLDSWLNDDFSVDAYPPEAKPILSRNSEEALRYLPPKTNSFSSFFNRPYTSLKSKLRNDCLFLSVMIFRSDHKVLQTGSGLLPTLLVVDNFAANGGKDFSESSEEFSWILKSSMEWEKTNTSECYNPVLHNTSRHQGYCTSLRLAFCEAADNMMKILPIPRLGHLYEQLIALPQYNSKTFLSVQYVNDALLPTIATESIKNGTLKWRSIESLDQDVYAPCYSVLSQAWTLYAARNVKPSPGLYVGLYYMETATNGMNILLPRDRKHMIPMIKIREAPDLKDEEWKLLLEAKKDSNETDLSEDMYFSLQARKDESASSYFKYQFATAFLKLQHLVRLNLNVKDLYDVGPVDFQVPKDLGKLSGLMDTVRIILIVKPLRLLQESNSLQSYAHHPRLAMYPFRHFETIHNHMYNPQYVPYRRKMLSFQNHLHEARRGVLTCVQQLKLSSGKPGPLTKEVALSLIQERIDQLKSTWPTISWSVRVLDWDRARQWQQSTKTQAVLSGGDSSIKRHKEDAPLVNKNPEKIACVTPVIEELQGYTNNILL